MYTAYHFKIHPLQPASEILIAELGLLGFESFMENPDGISAFIKTTDWNAKHLKQIPILQSDAFKISYTTENIQQENWNQTWEDNFKPITVDNLVTVRAPFHSQSDLKYNIIIAPKMSFGTGHHATTYMMIQHILKNDFSNKTVLDMGCGTGVLAILAEKLGAKSVDAIDNDAWCYQNSLENILHNACHTITVQQGNVELIAQKQYDIILANINRKTLLQYIPYYAKSLNKNGMLFLSGFYKEDITVLKKQCEYHFLNLKEIKERNTWISLKFIN